VFSPLRHLIALLVLSSILLTASSSILAQDKTDVRNINWQTYLKSQAEWLEARQYYAHLVAEHAKAELQAYQQQMAAERELLIHEYALKAYREGLREVRLIGLRNEIVVLGEKAKQAVVRRDWSIKLANRGLISQKELEADEIAVERLSGQLNSKKDELKLEEEKAVSSDEEDLIVALKQATSVLRTVSTQAAMEKASRLEEIDKAEKESQRLKQELQQMQWDFERFREFLRQQETRANTSSRQADIQMLQSDMQSAKEAEPLAIDRCDKSVEQWQRHIDDAQQTQANLENEVAVDSAKLRALEADVQGAQEKVNQSIQNESWANRVKRKGFITQVLYEKYSLALLESRLNLNYHQQKFEAETEILSSQQQALRDFDTQGLKQATQLTTEAYRQVKSHRQFVVDNLRQQAESQLTVLNILKASQ